MVLSVCLTSVAAGAAAGQAVFGQVAGSLASHVVADSTLVVPMPPTVTLQQACTMPTVFMTADMAFQHAMHVAPGTQALLHAAAGMSLPTGFGPLQQGPPPPPYGLLPLPQ